LYSELTDVRTGYWLVAIILNRWSVSTVTSGNCVRSGTQCEMFWNY